MSIAATSKSLVSLSRQGHCTWPPYTKDAPSNLRFHTVYICMYLVGLLILRLPCLRVVVVESTSIVIEHLPSRW